MAVRDDDIATKNDTENKLLSFATQHATLLISVVAFYIFRISARC